MYMCMFVAFVNDYHVCISMYPHYQVNQVLSAIDNFTQSLSFGQNLTEIVNLVCNTKIAHAYKYSYSSSFFNSL